MAERSRDWFEQAARDLENARWDAKGGFHEWACFVAQQAAEKAVKAVYQKLGGDAWGHSVAALLEGLRSRVQVAEELEECGKALDRFYVPARDPSSWAEGAPKNYYTAEDADRAIACAERILRFCDGLLAGQG
ncbi:MAG: HEPN domain-containing protein [Gemmatimonadetes bacterium]|nr:HEPN domain-containing protein [Gemmatimonadota bacterium]